MNAYRFTPKPKKEIDAGLLENLFAEGLEQQEIADRLGIAATDLSRRINNSYTLYEARRRGLERAAVR